jgi:DNA-binding IclR family transcriptional regulator
VCETPGVLADHFFYLSRCAIFNDASGGRSQLHHAASVEFDQITRPIMSELSQAVGETVDLSVLKGSVAIFTDQVQGIHRLRAVSAIGETFPLHCTANGKAILSVLSDDKVARLLRRSPS